MESEPDELVRFREQWKAEVTRRNQARVSPPSGDEPASSTASDTLVQPVPTAHSAQGQQDRLSHRHLSSLSTGTSKRLASAVETYRLATQYEQVGKLDEALRLYRNAFRIDANVDKAYRRDELRLDAVASNADSLHTKLRRRASLLTADEPLPSKNGPVLKAMPQRRLETGALISLVSLFPRDTEFEASDESEGVPLRLVPDEIIVLVLKMLDPLSIETFALLGRKARVLSLDSSIWRSHVLKTYVPPQIPDDMKIDKLAEQYLFDYRRLYVEHPRLRLDGVYIAVCHYIRPGMSIDNAWVHVNHLITYHRYLRFFPDGTVLSLLANEDVEPQTIVHALEPSLRMKGLLIGNWSLEGSTIAIRDLADPICENRRYMFQMTLDLRSKPIGRWNRLDLAGYDSVNTEDGETVPLSLKHVRPFWFSKVRSYYNVH